MPKQSDDPGENADTYQDSFGGFDRWIAATDAVNPITDGQGNVSTSGEYGNHS